MNLSIDQVNNDDILPIWEKSVFKGPSNHPAVLEVLADRVDWWVLKKGKEIILIYPVLLDDQEKVDYPGFLCNDVGPLWMPYYSEILTHSRLSKEISFYDYLFDFLIDKYKEVKFTTSLKDVRFFSWFNYDNDKPKFKIVPKYTARSIIHSENQKFEKDFRELRKRQIRKFYDIEDATLSTKVNVYFNKYSVKTDRYFTQEVIDLYCHVVEKDGKVVPEVTKNRIKNLLKLDKRLHYSFSMFDEYTKNLVSFYYLLNYGDRVDMLLNLTHSDYKPLGVTAKMTLDVLRYAAQKEYNFFDFCGANSPLRGDDKHSYGAFPVLYFEISYPNLD